MFEHDIDRVRQGVAVFNTLHYKKQQRPFSLEEEEETPQGQEKPATPQPTLHPPEAGHHFDRTA